MHPRSSHFVRRFNACVHSHSDHGRYKWHTHLTNHGYFDYWKNTNTPNLSPMQESKWRRFWDLWSISVIMSLNSIKNVLFLNIQVITEVLIRRNIVQLLSFNSSMIWFISPHSTHYMQASWSSATVPSITSWFWWVVWVTKLSLWSIQ